MLASIEAHLYSPVDLSVGLECVQAFPCPGFGLYRVGRNGVVTRLRKCLHHGTTERWESDSGISRTSTVYTVVAYSFANSSVLEENETLTETHLWCSTKSYEELQRAICTNN